MSDTQTVKSILKRINSKVGALKADKDAAEEIKADLKELAGFVDSSGLSEQIEQLSGKIDLLETNNASLKDSVYDFVKSTTKTLETISDTASENTPVALREFLSELEEKLLASKPESEEKVSHNEEFKEEYFKNFTKELNFFQNELETRISDDLDGINSSVAEIIKDVKDSLNDLKESVDNHSEKLMTDIISDVKQLKSDTLQIITGLKSVGGISFAETEKKLDKIILAAEKSNETMLGEIVEIKNNIVPKTTFEKIGKETTDRLKVELTALKTNINAQIREVLSKILLQDEIKFLCEEAITGVKSNNTEIGVVRKYLKDLKIGDEKQALIFTEMRNIVAKLAEYGISDSADKIDIIYDNMSMLNTWATSSDKLGESFEELRDDINLTTDKVDIVYENLTFINEWVQTLDKFSKDIENLKNQCDDKIHMPEKINDIYDNINAVKDWGKKADALALQIRALSVQIGETESTMNSQNLADIKRQFIQLNEDMANMSNRTNKLILDSDKSNETMQGHLTDLQLLISDLNRKAKDTSIDKLATRLEEIRRLSAKNSNFEKVLTESFMYLAEWIDSAGGAINEIKSAVSNMPKPSLLFPQNQQSGISPEILQAFKELGNAIERTAGENKMNMMQLVNTLSVKPSQVNYSDDSDIKTLLDFIATQVVNANENALKTDTLTKRIESLEQKISSFERYMSKLVDYLEED